MAIQLVTMYFQDVNISLQRGDTVFYVPTTNIGNVSSVKIFARGIYEEIIEFGTVYRIDRTTEPKKVKILWDDSIPLAGMGDFILFAKNKEANTSSLVGYYARANFVNDSNKKAELFSVSSEVSISSK